MVVIKGCLYNRELVRCDSTANMVRLLHSSNAVCLICLNVTFHKFFSITFICSHLLAQKICTQSATVIYRYKLKCKTS